MTVHTSKELLPAPMDRRSRKNRRGRKNSRGRHSQLLPQPAFRLMLCLQMLFILGGLRVYFRFILINSFVTAGGMLKTKMHLKK